MARWVGTLLLLWSLPVGGESYEPAPTPTAGTWERSPWQDDLVRVADLLKEQGKSRAWRAAEICQRLVGKGLSQIVDHPQAPSILARALALLSVAQLRQGEGERARWLASEAASFDGQEAGRTLESFPDAMAKFSRWLETLKRDAVLDRYLTLPPEHSPAKPVHLSPLPSMASSLPAEKLVPARVLLVVDEHGVPVGPVLLQSSGDVSFDLALMESLSGWVFIPASEHGHPAVGYYLVTASLKGKNP